MKYLILTAFAFLLNPLAQASTYNVDPAHSALGFEVLHLGMTKVPGKFKDFKGSFDFDDKTQTLTNLSIEIQTASIDTSNNDRDTHLKSPDFFDVAKHPTATFTITKPVKITGKAIEGELTLLGKTEKVPVKINFNGITQAMGGTKTAFEATTKIDRTKFGMVWNKEVEGAKKPNMLASATNKAKDMLVSNEVAINISVEANQKK